MYVEMFPQPNFLQAPRVTLNNIHVNDITENSQSLSFVHSWQRDNYVYPYLQQSGNSRLILGYFSSERNTLAYRVV